MTKSGQHTSLERQQKLFYCRESFLKQEYKLRLTPTELLELSLSLLASGKLEGDSKSVTQIGTVRFFLTSSTCHPKIIFK